MFSHSLLNRGLCCFHRIEKTISMVLIHAMALYPILSMPAYRDEIIPTKKIPLQSEEGFFGGMYWTSGLKSTRPSPVLFLLKQSLSKINHTAQINGAGVGICSED